MGYLRSLCSAFRQNELPTIAAIPAKASANTRGKNSEIKAPHLVSKEPLVSRWIVTGLPSFV